MASSVSFIFRFYGRFLFVRDRQKEDVKRAVTILSPTLEFPPEVSRHIPVLAIERNLVASSSLITTVPPTLRAIPGEDPRTAEYLFWDLSGTELELPGTDGVSFAEEDPVPNLIDLERTVNREARLDERFLRPGPGIGSVIRLQGGSIHAKSVHKSAAKFVKENVARKGYVSSKEEETPKFALNGKDLADWIELKIDIPAIPDLDPPEAQVAIPMSGRTNGWLTIKGKAGTVVSFSNLCPSGPRVPQRFEFEFAQFYELLEATGRDRLIPEFNHAGQEDCNQSAQIFRDV